MVSCPEQLFGRTVGYRTDSRALGVVECRVWLRLTSGSGPYERQGLSQTSSLSVTSTEVPALSPVGAGIFSSRAPTHAPPRANGRDRAPSLLAAVAGSFL